MDQKQIAAHVERLALKAGGMLPLSKQSGVSRATIYRIARWGKMPDVGTLERLGLKVVIARMASSKE